MNKTNNDSEYKNRLHESLSMMYTHALHNYPNENDPTRKDIQKQLRYLIKWINNKGGNIPKK